MCADVRAVDVAGTQVVLTTPGIHCNDPNDSRYNSVRFCSPFGCHLSRAVGFHSSCAFAAHSGLVCFFPDLVASAAVVPVKADLQNR